MKTKKFDLYHFSVNAILSILSIGIIVPFLLVLSISFSEEQSILTNGYRLIPEEFSLLSYEVVLKSAGPLISAYGVTIFVTFSERSAVCC
ncbi:hypothetical protein [Litoribacterium kuwaitense]|uniref:hypothetical protein n=1 Tax=Litoribacterium kuwaitense TaxID=1398745 RepID=UPI001FE40B1B|nr:hypothetical protein [Litoribacterium kuwaitense]